MAQEKQQKEYAACPVAFYTENCDSVDHSRRMRHNSLCLNTFLNVSLPGDAIFMRRERKSFVLDCTGEDLSSCAESRLK